MELLKKLPSCILPGSALYCKRLGQQKKRKDSFQWAPGFCADGIFIFAVYFDMDTLLERKSTIPLTNNDKPIYVVKSDFVSQVYIIRTKIHDQNKNAVGNESVCFFFCPKGLQ